MGQWFYTTARGDNAMRAIAQKLGGSLTASQPASVTSAIVTRDKLPTPLAAGQPFKVGFTVAKQGKAISPSDTLIVTGTHGDDSASSVFIARADDALAYYTVTFTLPQDGIWYWSVDLGAEGRQELTPLRVGAVTQSSDAPDATTSPAQTETPTVMFFAS